MELAKIQQEIRNQNLDGWLFFDHHMRDPLAYRVLDLTVPRTPTRRWYYLIPAEGEPRGLEHRIERGMTGSLPGEKIPYSSWPEQVEGLRRITKGLRKVAMQYSPNCAIPYVSMVDGGTIELVRSLGLEVVSFGRADSILRSALERPPPSNRTSRRDGGWTVSVPTPSPSSASASPTARRSMSSR